MWATPAWKSIAACMKNSWMCYLNFSSATIKILVDNLCCVLVFGQNIRNPPMMYLQVFTLHHLVSSSSALHHLITSNREKVIVCCTGIQEALDADHTLYTPCDLSLLWLRGLPCSNGWPEWWFELESSFDVHRKSNQDWKVWKRSRLFQLYKEGVSLEFIIPWNLSLQRGIWNFSLEPSSKWTFESLNTHSNHLL